LFLCRCDIMNWCGVPVLSIISSLNANQNLILRSVGAAAQIPARGKRRPPRRSRNVDPDASGLSFLASRKLWGQIPTHRDDSKPRIFSEPQRRSRRIGTIQNCKSSRSRSGDPDASGQFKTANLPLYFFAASSYAFPASISLSK